MSQEIRVTTPDYNHFSPEEGPDLGILGILGFFLFIGGEAVAAGTSGEPKMWTLIGVGGMVEGGFLLIDSIFSSFARR